MIRWRYDMERVLELTVCITALIAKKRALELTFCIIALIVVAPHFLLIALAIKFESPGPVFVKQRRRNGDCYIYKFRTMPVQEYAAVMTEARKDNLCSGRVSKFLRETSLDYMPALINVLRGEISLIGLQPRAVTKNEAGTDGLRWLLGEVGAEALSSLMDQRRCALATAAPADVGRLKRWYLLVMIDNIVRIALDRIAATVKLD